MTERADFSQTSDDMGAVLFELLWGGERRAIPTAVDHVYEMIWRQLMMRERRPGERLTDVELASQLGVSRTPVRQALHRLAQEELIRFDPRHGFSVRSFTAPDVREIFEVRGALEVLALRLAAPHLRADELRAELDLLYEVRDAIGTAPDERSTALFLQADVQLHNLFARCSGNGRLVRILATLRSQHGMLQYWGTFHPQRNQAASDEHESILLALIAGRTERAAEFLAQHIANAKNRILADLFGAEPARPTYAEDEGPSEPDYLRSSYALGRPAQE